MFFSLQRICLVLLALVMISACSSSDEKDQPGVIKQTTDKIAEDVVKSIKTPIDQAKIAKGLVESHNRTVEDGVKKQ